MAWIVFGENMVDENVVMTAYFNGNSPLVWDETQLTSMRIYAAANQAMLISPLVLYGASTPVHILAGRAQIVAEVIAAICPPRLPSGHGCATTEGLLCISMAKVATDGRQLQSVYTMLQGASFDNVDVALDGLPKVGPGGHFFGEDYTREKLPCLDEIQDNERYESWQATGSKGVSERGREWCRNMLERYSEEPPALARATALELREFVVRREPEIPAGVA